MATLKSKKSALIFLSIVVLGASGYVFAVNYSKDSSDTNSSNSNQTDSQVEEKTYTPEEILAKIDSLKKQELSLKGSLIKAGNEYYIIGAPSDDKTKPNALKADFSKAKGVNPDDYANMGSLSATAPTSSQSQDFEIRPPVTITGKLTQTNSTSGQYHIEVVSLTK